MISLSPYTRHVSLNSARCWQTMDVYIVEQVAKRVQNPEGWRIMRQLPVLHKCNLTLPYLTFGAGAQGTPALRLQFAPNAQPGQTSWSMKSPRGFCKPQENRPVDTAKSVQWERVITEDRSSQQHCGIALGNEMNWSFLLILAEGTYRLI